MTRDINCQRCPETTHFRGASIGNTRFVRLGFRDVDLSDANIGGGRLELENSVAAGVDFSGYPWVQMTKTYSTSTSPPQI